MNSQRNLRSSNGTSEPIMVQEEELNQIPEIQLEEHCIDLTKEDDDVMVISSQDTSVVCIGESVSTSDSATSARSRRQQSRNRLRNRTRDRDRDRYVNELFEDVFTSSLFDVSVGLPNLTPEFIDAHTAPRLPMLPSPSMYSFDSVFNNQPSIAPQNYPTAISPQLYPSIPNNTTRNPATASAYVRQQRPPSPPPRIGAIACSICLEDNSEIHRTGKQLMSTNCGHLFCKTCLDEAFKIKRVCPACRKKLTVKQVHPIYI